MVAKYPDRYPEDINKTPLQKPNGPIYKLRTHKGIIAEGLKIVTIIPNDPLCKVIYCEDHSKYYIAKLISECWELYCS
jgi:hypothetical protein